MSLALYQIADLDRVNTGVITKLQFAALRADVHLDDAQLLTGEFEVGHFKQPFQRIRQQAKAVDDLYL